MATTSDNRQKWLRRAGLIVGLAGALGLTLLIFVTNGEGFNSYSVSFVIVEALPLLIMVVIAWKWSLVGGILLIAGGLFWPVARLTATLLETLPQPSLTLATVILPVLPVSLPYLITGILFLLSVKGIKRKELIIK